MTRVAIGRGAWLNLDDAIVFEEAVAWNGDHWISCATLSQFDHESLLYSRRGVFVIHYWSLWTDTPTERYERVSHETAAAWLADQHHAVSEKLKRLPLSVQRAVRQAIRECEV